MEGQARFQNVSIRLLYLTLLPRWGRYCCPGFIEEVPEAGDVKGPAKVPDLYVAKLGSDAGVLIVNTGVSSMQGSKPLAQVQVT